MRIEDRDGSPALVDDAGLEVRRGDPLWVGCRLCFFDHAELWPGVGPVMLMLRDQPDAPVWQRTISATSDKLGRLSRAAPNRARPPSTHDVPVGERWTGMARSRTITRVIHDPGGSVGMGVG